LNFLFPTSISPREKNRARLLTLAAVFLFLYSAIITLSNTVRLRTWNAPLRWEQWVGYLAWLAGFSLLHRQFARRLPDGDPYLLPIAGLLTGWGLLEIWRLDTNLGAHQTVWLVLSVLMVYFGLQKKEILAVLHRYKYVWLSGGLLLTILTFFLGTYPGGNGPRLWLGYGGVYLQPSEPLKLLLIVYLAAYMADQIGASINLMKLLTPTLLLAGLSVSVLLAQHDLGTVTLFILLYTITVYFASGRRRVLVISLVAILIAGLAGYLLFDVVRLRVDAWLNPWIDSSGRSFQIVQSIIAIASGGLIGTGPALGSPSLVPVANSDFIFAAIGEETGLLGSVGLLLLLALVVYRGLWIAVHAPNLFQRTLVAGLSVYFASQSILIIGGNLRLVPLTGVTLPFVSYGGSSLVTAFFSLLLLCLISNHPDEEPAPLPSPVPYLLFLSLSLAAFFVLAVFNGWWGLVRADDLQSRTDNLRRVIADRYVMRGSLLDRSNLPIDVTVGKPGNLTRSSLYPPLSPVVGYTHSTYGQAGLEASLDAYLRGLQGNPTSLVWTNHLLYSQPPPGLDVRLSLDLSLQTQVDNLLKDKNGAAVLLNAETGEILVMASHPYFDPNQLDQKWETYTNDPHSPFINRAVMGQYPAGTALGPFLLAEALQQGALPSSPYTLDLSAGSQTYHCAYTPTDTKQWNAVLMAGCPGALNVLGNRLQASGLTSLFTKLGFYEAPDLPLIVAQPASQQPITNQALASIGQENLLVSPLQMALAAAALSANGVRPTPRLAMAVDTPSQGWVTLISSPAQNALSAETASSAAHLLAVSGTPFWQVTGLSNLGQNKYVWVVGGTLPSSQGSPLALALLLEENNPDLARQIGEKILLAAQHP
jgi:cell division protein FtsW (lipid II flippase)